MAAGVIVRNTGNTIDPITGRPIVKPASPLKPVYDTYNAATKTQGGDYDSIMQAYKNLLNPASSTTDTLRRIYTPYTPQSYNYAPSGDVTSSLGNLSELARTGGYSDKNVADIRARGISPIRAIYANAQRNVDRQRALQGGYSPNYNAVSAKMARELSDQLATKSTDVEAQIADMIAKGRLSAAPAYASAAGAENELRNRIGLQNTQFINEANQRNAEGMNQFMLKGTEEDINRQLEALRGMTSLYGTTPALTNLFGNQALNFSQFRNQVNQQNRQPGLSVLSSLLPGLR